MVERFIRLATCIGIAGTITVGTMGVANAQDSSLIGSAESEFSSNTENNISARDSHGDILAPGILNINYLHVYGKGLHVDRVDVGARSTNLQPIQESICGGQAEIAYYQGGVRKTQVLDIPGCTLPSGMLRPGHYVTFDLNQDVDNGSKFCAKSNIGKGWSPYACVDIHS